MSDIVYNALVEYRRKKVPKSYYFSSDQIMSYCFFVIKNNIIQAKVNITSQIILLVYLFHLLSMYKLNQRF